MKNNSRLRFSDELLIKWKKQKRKAHVTVCIAAICNNGVIMGASDRMMTAGDVEFEPLTQGSASSKIISLTSSIVAMTAGDAGLQAEILQRVFAIVNNRVLEQPKNWWAVKDVVDLYFQIFNEIKSERASRVFLAPFGLNAKSFIENQKQLTDSFVKQITSEMVNFEMPQIETIICGVDLSSPFAHIYKLWNNGYVCCDPLGFACVGIGARHAELEFMSAGHNRSSLMPETLLLIYTAKKRSEVAPGVGKETDMFTMGPNLGTFAFLKDIPDLDIGILEKTYQSIIKKERQIQEGAKKQTKEYVTELLKKRTAVAQQTAENPTAAEPSNAEKDTPDASEKS
jgi:hypothetical protein